MKVRETFVSNSSSQSYFINTHLKLDRVKFILGMLVEARNIAGDTKYTIDDCIEFYKLDDGSIRVDGVDDNSIPYYISEFINSYLN